VKILSSATEAHRSWFSGLWRRIISWAVTNVSEERIASILRVIISPEDRGNTFFRNVGNHLQYDTASQVRRPRSTCSPPQWRSLGWRGGSGAAAPGGTVQRAAEWRIFSIKFLSPFATYITKKHLLRSSNQPVCTHETTRERLNRFSLNFVSDIFTKNCRTIPNFMMIGKPEVVIINYYTQSLWLNNLAPNYPHRYENRFILWEIFLYTSLIKHLLNESYQS
jgi:hypothetical protein